MNKNNRQVSYKNAGVDKEEGYRAVEKMKASVAATRGPQVLGGLGSFASLYSLEGWTDPVLVSGTDGVGTKLRLALDAGQLDVIGRDCYAMVGNDILCHGARPLFFLDYLACGKLEADKAAGIVAGMAGACMDDGCALVGGETAEMPGFYAPGDYDVAGFAVGAVERSKMVNGSAVEEGNVIIGIASNGLHSNGFSLIRALIRDTSVDFGGKPIIDELLIPTRLYGSSVRSLQDQGFIIRGMAHITGGGLPENLPRAFNREIFEARVDISTWKEPDIFEYIRSLAVPEDEMRGTFNMGIGFILIVSESDVPGILDSLEKSGEKAWNIGSIFRGNSGVCYV
ncbi:MAG: phosphoribosylformylglycinamidine cyclo-ligase [Spirochaetaceae bacterium]|nr:phosphoribosylformylglycinamidine cyclo-ligase [Spirochaetaceae bacterium]